MTGICEYWESCTLECAFKEPDEDFYYLINDVIRCHVTGGWVSILPLSRFEWIMKKKVEENRIKEIGKEVIRKIIENNKMNCESIK